MYFLYFYSDLLLKILRIENILICFVLAHTERSKDRKRVKLFILINVRGYNIPLNPP